jgi:hypothetical protein
MLTLLGRSGWFGIAQLPPLAFTKRSRTCSLSVSATFLESATRMPPCKSDPDDTPFRIGMVSWKSCTTRTGFPSPCSTAKRQLLRPHQEAIRPAHRLVVVLHVEQKRQLIALALNPTSVINSHNAMKAGVIRMMKEPSKTTPALRKSKDPLSYAGVDASGWRITRRGFVTSVGILTGSLALGVPLRGAPATSTDRRLRTAANLLGASIQ